MFKTTGETASYIDALLERLDTIPAEVGLVVCPPFTALETCRDRLRSVRGRVSLGAQNMHWEATGAFTGEISAPMLLDLAVDYVIVGHSERRRYFGETDESVRLKTAAALAFGLTPIVAVGESLEIRESGGTEAFVTAQVHAALQGLDQSALGRVVIAYEPIWAIGTGRNCDPSQANKVMRAIRDTDGALCDVPILYGGSVNAENIGSYTEQPGIDGGLVGGASLDPIGFALLAKRASA